MNEQRKHRLITRSDFDGLVCAILLRELNLIEEIAFVHPKDMQDGKIQIGDNDITTNLPYVPGCFLAFDHHASEAVRLAGEFKDNHVIDIAAASAARVVYDYYGGVEAFPRISKEMMAAVDKSDAAQFSPEEVLNPKGWILLSFLTDARTGLGRFRDFRVSNYQLMMQLIDACRQRSIEDVLDLPDVHQRAQLYREHETLAQDQIRSCAELHGPLVLLDLRDEETIYATNRFTVYALFPESNISIHLMWGLRRQNTVFAIGKSIINRSSRLHIGELCLEYGGGGHANAGTCQVSNELAESVKTDLIARIVGQ